MKKTILILLNLMSFGAVRSQTVRVLSETDFSCSAVPYPYPFRISVGSHR
jgi:hypothetical protein